MELRGSELVVLRFTMQCLKALSERPGDQEEAPQLHLLQAAVTKCWKGLERSNNEVRGGYSRQSAGTG